MHKEFRYITNLLQSNGYPKAFVEKHIKSVLQKLNQSMPNIPVLTVPQKELLIVLPYTGSHGFMIRTKLQRLMKRFFPTAKLRVVFKPTAKLSHFFSYKDVTPKALQSMVVYKYSCAGCNACYIGQTSRHLATRIAEHKGVYVRTGQPLSCPSFSAVRTHAADSGHGSGTFDGFEILAKASNRYDLGIMESLYIQRYMPSLNKMTSACELHLFKA